MILMNRFWSGKNPCLCPEGWRRQVFPFASPAGRCGTALVRSWLLPPDSWGQVLPISRSERKGTDLHPDNSPCWQTMLVKKWILFLLLTLRRGRHLIAESGLGSNARRAGLRAGAPWGCPFPSAGPFSGCLPKTLSPSETPSWRAWGPQASWSPADLFLEVICLAVNVYTH